MYFHINFVILMDIRKHLIYQYKIYLTVLLNYTTNTIVSLKLFGGHLLTLHYFDLLTLWKYQKLQGNL